MVYKRKEKYWEMVMVMLSWAISFNIIDTPECFLLNYTVLIMGGGGITYQLD